MIASVIANLPTSSEHVLDVVEQLVAHPQIEVGDLVDGHRLPLTIDADSKKSMDETTRWIQSLSGVVFVDVVFVHFENDQLDETSPEQR